MFSGSVTPGQIAHKKFLWNVAFKHGGWNKSNSVMKPADTLEKGQRKHEVEWERSIRPVKVGDQEETE